MSIELISAVGKRFIQRRDVKAKQSRDGKAYFPVVDKATDAKVPFVLSDFEHHFAGTETFGHYLLDAESKCKLFAFDVDLKPKGFWPEFPLNIQDLYDGKISEDDYFGSVNIHEFSPRESWRNRNHASRQFVKTQMRTLAHEFAAAVTKTLEIPVAAAYTGCKGFHVYGFTGTVDASLAREGAQLVLDAMDSWEPSLGKVFFTHKDQRADYGYPNFSLEVFPKQDSLDGKELGNLMRLPLGKNFKAPNDPTFFIDLKSAFNELRPVADPVALLESGDPWS